MVVKKKRKKEKRKCLGRKVGARFQKQWRPFNYTGPALSIARDILPVRYARGKCTSISWRETETDDRILPSRPIIRCHYFVTGSHYCRRKPLHCTSSSFFLPPRSDRMIFLFVASQQRRISFAVSAKLVAFQFPPLFFFTLSLDFSRSSFDFYTKTMNRWLVEILESRDCIGIEFYRKFTGIWRAARVT